MHRRSALRRFTRSRAADERWLPAAERTPGRRLGRRAWLKRAGAATAAVGAAVAANNVVLGYGVVTGTNITEQSIADLAEAPFAEMARRAWLPGGRLELDRQGTRFTIHGDGRRRFPVADATPAAAREAAREVGVAPVPVGNAVADVQAFQRGGVEWVPVPYDEFEATVARGTPRPTTTSLLRAYYYGTDPAVVESFTGADPRDPMTTATALAEAFRETTYYDIPRYVAGSIQFNVLMGTVDLRQYLRSDTSFEALAEGRTRGMFCQELAQRSVQAFHAPAVWRQSPPVAATVAYDPRHRHNYTAVATVTRRDGDLVVPITFLDYTHSTLYDDLGLRGVLGEGLDGYNSRHRAKELTWWAEL